MASCFLCRPLAYTAAWELIIMLLLPGFEPTPVLQRERGPSGCRAVLETKCECGCFDLCTSTFMSLHVSLH